MLEKSIMIVIVLLLLLFCCCCYDVWHRLPKDYLHYNSQSAHLEVLSSLLVSFLRSLPGYLTVYNISLGYMTV